MKSLFEYCAEQWDCTPEEASDTLVFYLRTSIHDGDCTKSSQPCALCALEKELSDYYKYTKKLNSEQNQRVSVATEDDHRSEP